MNDYLIDYETLGKFVDGLIAIKYPQKNAEADLATIREKSIREVNDKIEKEVFGGLTLLQVSDLEHLLDDPSATEQDYEAFFKKTGVDFEQKVTKTMQSFAQEFLGGNHD
ncbi:hypothetical protein J6X73_02895 [Candidatus Saccharibacteria bacterium]|nr:hypothetical protein [Candidatus Saccharibacteria bacterium]